MSLKPESRKSKKRKKRLSEVELKEGALRSYVQRRYGKSGFTEEGTIRVSVLHELIRDEDVTMTTRRRAQLALNFREMSKSKGK